MRPTYLNNATTTWPKPKEVIKAINESLKLPYSGSGRSATKGTIDYPSKTRKLVAEFFNAEDPNNVQFTSNVTESLNLIIHGHAAKTGMMHAVTTELEHNSVLRPLNHLARDGRISLTVVPYDEDGYVTLDAIQSGIKDDTKLVVMTHGSNVLGTLQDIAAIGDYLKKKGIYFAVDAAQTAGHERIDLSKLNVDALAFTGHKSLFAFQGIGGFYVRDPKLVAPVKQGGTGSHSEDPYQPDTMPLKYEAGTLNYPGIVSLQAGIRYLQKVGMKRIAGKTMNLTKALIRGLSPEDNITVYNREPDLPIVSFNIDGVENEDVAYILLEEYNIVSRSGLHCAPLLHKRLDGGIGCCRLSPHYFNTAAECGKAVEAISAIAGSAR